MGNQSSAVTLELETLLDTASTRLGLRITHHERSVDGSHKKLLAFLRLNQATEAYDAARSALQHQRHKDLALRLQWHCRGIQSRVHELSSHVNPPPCLATSLADVLYCASDGNIIDVKELYRIAEVLKDQYRKTNLVQEWSKQPSDKMRQLLRESTHDEIMAELCACAHTDTDPRIRNCDFSVLRELHGELEEETKKEDHWDLLTTVPLDDTSDEA